jgi:UPF0755 protein
MVNFPKKIIVFFIIAAAVAAAFFYFTAFKAPQSSAKAEAFVIPLNTDFSTAVAKLKSEGFVRSGLAFRLIFVFGGGTKIPAGGYEISKSMNVLEIAGVLSQTPAMKWAVVPEGLRKEEIASIVAKTVGWSNEQKQNWLASTAAKSDYFEGVYFPDTYLIPVAGTGDEISQKFINRFNEEFKPYLEEANRQNIKWTTVLKIASIIQREAGGESDMPVISGVIWNRLLIGMKLDMDSTLQYARGDVGSGWWAGISSKDKQISSPYNTYKYAGLPPHPICNPGVEAIKATVYPAKTKCLYYLHDSEGVIHCAATYEEHKLNIAKYLR